MIKFALIGCGAIAKRHADILSGGAVPGAGLAAVCDLNARLAGEFGSRYHVPHFTDFDSLTRAGAADAVTILTPSGFHAQHAVELSSRFRAIVVEKPMALTLSDADQMVEACDRNGARLFVVKQNRFNRPIVALRRAIEAGRFGKLVLGTVRVRWCRPQAYYDQAAWRGTWANDGGVIANQAIHHIDLLEWMLGPVDSISAMGTRALAKIEAEDTAVAILRFRNGALGVVEATTATRPKDLEGSLSVLGEHGAVEVGGFAANQLKTWNFSATADGDKTVFAEHGENPADKLGYAHTEYYKHVVECLRENKRQLVDGLEGRKSLELITAIYEAIETGREVRLRFSPQRCRLGLK